MDALRSYHIRLILFDYVYLGVYVCLLLGRQSYEYNCSSAIFSQVFGESGSAATISVSARKKRFMQQACWLDKMKDCIFVA